MSLSTREYIESILGKVNWDFSKASAGAFAPSNIALSKYWGKRDKALNLPFTDSVSISLGNLGAVTNVKNTQEDNDVVFLNDIEVDRNNPFYIRLVKFLDLCRPGDDFKFSIDTVSNIPVGAGIASSACGFAALTKALNEFFSWGLSNEKLSMLARLGSGSAARSMWDGFVYWHAGNSNDGKDCYAELMPYEWPEIRVGLILIETGPKIISSTDAMNRCVATSKFYSDWPKVCNVVLREVCSAIESKDFEKLGYFSEHSATKMHEMIRASVPSIDYSTIKTYDAIERILGMRRNGHNVYFTQDAGPNIKVLYMKEEQNNLLKEFPEMVTTTPFKSSR